MPLLPDLTPWVSEQRGYLHDWVIQGDELRLTTAAVNIGVGDLELRGGEVNGGVQNVYQRIYEADGSYNDVLAGEFVYHEEHAHIHFEEFAEFRLRAVLPGNEVGDVVATGDKVSFCLLDVDRYDNSGPASPQHLSCGQIQGISPGWADVYDKGLPGQSINIAGVPDGIYWLEMLVDPGNNLVEADETNNVARIQINLQRSGSEPGGIDELTAAQESELIKLYIGYFNRAPEYAGLQYHKNAVLEDLNAANPATFEQALLVRADAFYEAAIAAPEYSGYSASDPTDEFVRTIYENVLLRPGAGGPVSDAEVAYWSDKIDSGEIGRGKLVLEFFAAQPFLLENGTPEQVALAELTIQIIDNRITVAREFAKPEYSDGLTNAEAHAAGVAALEGVDDTQASVDAAIARLQTVGDPPLAPDTFEANDSFSTASILAPPEDHVYSNLSIHEANNDDFYRVTATNTGTLTMHLDFEHDDGNIDARVYDASFNLLTESVRDGSAPDPDHEQLEVDAISGEYVYVHVFGRDGATNPNYTFTVEHASHSHPDLFESNNDFASASLLSATSDITYQNLSIHKANDDDYYQVVASETGSLSVNLAFDHSAGDIDLQVFDASQALLGTSESVADGEQVSVDAVAGEAFFVRAYGYDGATNTSYTMTVDQPEAGLPGDDYEPNDSFAAATVIASTDDVTLQDLSIHQANNDDYYQVVAAETGSLSVSLAFDHSAGDLDLQVFDASQALLGTSESVANSEQLSIGATAGESYYIRAYGYDGAVNPNYTMTVDQPEAGLPGDDYEPNDSFATAAVIASTDGVTLQDLSIHQANNDDYYQVVAAETGSLSVSLAFDHSAGDLDLQVFDASQALLAASESAANSEQVSINVTEGDSYYVRVYGYNGAVNTGYQMTVDSTATASAVVPVASNDIQDSVVEAEASGTSPFNDIQPDANEMLIV